MENKKQLLLRTEDLERQVFLLEGRMKRMSAELDKLKVLSETVNAQQSGSTNTGE